MAIGALIMVTRMRCSSSALACARWDLATVTHRKSQPGSRTAQTRVKLEHTTGNFVDITRKRCWLEVFCVIRWAGMKDQVTAVALGELNPTPNGFVRRTRRL